MSRLILKTFLFYIGVTGLVLAVDSWQDHYKHALFEGFVGAMALLLATAPNPPVRGGEE